jgi:hypothetical protein
MDMNETIKRTTKNWKKIWIILNFGYPPSMSMFCLYINTNFFYFFIQWLHLLHNFNFFFLLPCLVFHILPFCPCIFFSLSNCFIPSNSCGLFSFICYIEPGKILFVELITATVFIKNGLFLFIIYYFSVWKLIKMAIMPVKLWKIIFSDQSKIVTYQ